jgi:predicted short-subunit dehydrogenase-like oxidoreductase (DUF2520 family)
MNKLDVNIIGAGRVGQTLGRLLVKAQFARIQAVVTRSALSARAAIEWIGQGDYYAMDALLPPADLTVLTTPDDTLVSVSVALARNGYLRQGDGVIHCSGRYDSSCLQAVRESGCWVASLHPLCSIAQPALSLSSLAGTLCALEGDEAGMAVLQALCAAIGGVPFLLGTQQKALYHAASVFAANYTVTLAELARTCFQQAGIEHVVIKPMVQQLMHSSLTNLAQVDLPAEALTGPLQRGDVATIHAHLNALPPDARACYLALARATRPLLSAGVSQQLVALLDE